MAFKERIVIENRLLEPIKTSMSGGLFCHYGDKNAG